MTGDAARRVALLAPMGSELRPLVRALALRRRPGDGHAWRWGALGSLELVATTTGIGTRAAARTAERILDAFAVDHLVVVGIAGGIGSVALGDVVVPERVVDLVTETAYRPAPLGDAAPCGTLVTSDRLLVDPAETARLAERGVIAVDMETAAIAAVCEARRCPWSVFRAISDRADDGSIDAAVFGLVRPDGRPDLLAVARFALRRPRRVTQLLDLARGARRATHAAAGAAARALKHL